MKKKWILRGRNLFKLVSTAGSKIDSRLLRCRYVLETHHGGEDVKVSVGFKVFSRHVNAVQRNRVRRLMREAMRMEYHSLQASLPLRNTRIAMVLYFKGRDDVLVRRLSFAEIRKEVKVICQNLQSRLKEGA